MIEDRQMSTYLHIKLQVRVTEEIHSTAQNTLACLSALSL